MKLVCHRLAMGREAAQRKSERIRSLTRSSRVFGMTESGRMNPERGRAQDMERPASVTVIAGLFFLVAIFLVGLGFTEIVSPGSLYAARGFGVTYGRELTGAQTAISVGAGWALVGWGLYRLHNWARWCAVVLMFLGIAGSVPAVSAASRTLGWRFVWEGLQLMLRVVVTWYLLRAPEVLEVFGRSE